MDSLRTAVGSRFVRRAWIAVALVSVAVSASMLWFRHTRGEIKVRRGIETFNDALKRSTGEATTLGAIQHSRDDALLIEYSTAAVAGDDPTTLLLAFEAADAAYRLSPTAASARSRVIAARRIGLMQLNTAAVGQSIELFFQVEMVARATAFLTGASADGDPRAPAGDHLFDDTFAALAKLQTADDHKRAESAFAAFSHGRESFLANRPADAFAALAAAERDLNGLRIPAALMARDQRIRAQCWLASPECLDEIRRFRADLVASGRYPWLTARAAWAEGQTYYRAGRIYEAAETFETAETLFRSLNDFASVNVMHSLLGNTYAAAGETEIALTHYLAAIQEQTPQVSDRRRKQLEDPLELMLRHGYLATAAAILDELAAAPGYGSVAARSAARAPRRSSRRVP
jgi:tetratricopeptide (TPR) repeat protein